MPHPIYKMKKCLQITCASVIHILTDCFAVHLVTDRDKLQAIKTGQWSPESMEIMLAGWGSPSDSDIWFTVSKQKCLQ